MLEVTGLSVVYGQHRALEDVSIRVARGEIVVILGANGAGKSTLLKAVSGICEGQVRGRIALDGDDLTGLAPHRIVESGIALVPEGRGVFADLTVRENLLLGAYSDRAREDEAANLDRVHKLFPKLVERHRQVVRTMSGGEQQMVAIGRAMMSNPRILMLDEPSLGLSPLLCKELFQNLARVREIGIGILLVEQNARQSLAIADRGYLLENARIVHEGAAAALARDPAVQAAYLGAGAGPASAPPAPTATPAPAAAAAGHPDPLRPPLPAGFTVAPRSLQTVAADAILGRSVADLVAEAGARAQQSLSERRETAQRPSVQGHADRMAATLAGIERAAQAARDRTRGRRDAAPAAVRDLPGNLPRDAAPAGPAAAADPVTIEIYRAPRVEVWRRRPGSAEYDRQ